MDNEEGRFNFAIGAIIENSEGEILLIKRSPDNSPGNIWDVVGGGIQQFENPFDALTREIREETGIEEFEIIKMLGVFHNYEIDGFQERIWVTYWCKTNESSVRLSHEHVEYCWAKPEKALEISSHKDITINIIRFIEEKQKLGYSIG